MIWFFSAVKPDDPSVRKGKMSRRTGFFLVHEFRSASLGRARAQDRRLRELYHVECGNQNSRRGAGSQNASEYEAWAVERNATGSNNRVNADFAPLLPISHPFGSCTRQTAP